MHARESFLKADLKHLKAEKKCNFEKKGPGSFKKVPSSEQGNETTQIFKKAGV